MTKPAGTPRKKPESRGRRLGPHSADRSLLNRQGRLTSLTLSPPTLRNDADPGAVSNTWPTPPESTTKTTQSGPDPARNFFLGSTSYASVFTEEHPLPETAHEQPSEQLTAASSTLSRSMGHRHCQFALGDLIVSSLSPFSFFEKSLVLYFETHKAAPLVGPLILSALPQLRKDIELLKSADSDAYSLYAEITRNTARPMEVPATMRPDEFHTLFTGKNLRWETLGLVLVIAGSQAQFTSPNDTVFMLEGGKRINKDELIEDIIHATNVCINICQTHGAINDSKLMLLPNQALVLLLTIVVMVSLLYLAGLLVSNLYGDNRAYASGDQCEFDTND